MLDKIIKMPSLQEQVYLYLKTAIYKGELKSGQIYSEQWYADILGVSRTPVREAVLQLKQEYLLDIFPYKGFTVRPLSDDDVKETFQIRQALEGFCVILISENAGDLMAQKILGQLSDCLQEQRLLIGTGEVYEFMELDQLFHRDIINYSANERLIETYNGISSRFQRITINVLKEHDRMETTIREHADILKKMKEGLSWDAYRMMAVHMENTKRIIESITDAKEVKP